MRNGYNPDIIKERIAVVGAAESGLSAAKVLMDMGKEVFLSDSCGEKELVQRIIGKGLAGIDYEAEGNTRKILEYEQIVLSPGVPADNEVIKSAYSQGIPVWSEIELGYKLCRGRIIAVTGSTGKSTTVSLIGEALSSSGIRNTVCGNIGLPFSEVAQNIGPEDIAVVEVSSFQLESVVDFRPSVAVILNLYKNHLDRYSDEKEYYAAKKNILKNLSNNDKAVLFSGNSLLFEWAEEIPHEKTIFFGEHTGPGESVWWEGNDIFYTLSDKPEKVLDLSGSVVPGDHNKNNISAAAASLLSLGIGLDGLQNAVRRFSGLEHRMEYIGSFSGVKYYNDSKATTVESIRAALTAFDKPVVLIAGGRDKGCDFSLIREDIKKNIRRAVLIGEAKERIREEWGDVTEVVFADSMDDAIEKALISGRSEYTVLLSPGCSSFDMFDNYKHRGEVFRKLVKERKHV
ncbi:MAG: UDP-N-acetylmuramoyl-L-alanine--D-glutamate ligase [Chitinivibrionales bacterium]